MQNRLKELRQQRHWSQADLARALEVSRQAVNGFESGKFEPSLEMAFKIASLFHVAIEEVFIYEAKSTMQTLIEHVKNFFGFEFGFERFTENAIHAINYARHQAARSQSVQVEPEHLLAGLFVNPNSTSGRLLRASGAIADIVISKDSVECHENLKFGSQSKFVLELALQVVRLPGKKSIGTEHLLWGLIRLSEVNNTELYSLFQEYKIDSKSLNTQLIEAI